MGRGSNGLRFCRDRYRVGDLMNLYMNERTELIYSFVISYPGLSCVSIYKRLKLWDSPFNTLDRLRRRGFIRKEGKGLSAKYYVTS